MAAFRQPSISGTWHSRTRRWRVAKAMHRLGRTREKPRVGEAFTESGGYARRQMGEDGGRKSDGNLPFWRFFKLVKVCRREPSSGAKGCRLTVAIATVVDRVMLSQVCFGGDDK